MMSKITIVTENDAYIRISSLVSAAFYVGRGPAEALYEATRFPFVRLEHP